MTPQNKDKDKNMSKACKLALVVVVGLVWCGVARADGAVPGHEGQVPELVCTSAARPLEAGRGNVQVCTVVWVRAAK